MFLAKLTTLFVKYSPRVFATFCELESSQVQFSGKVLANVVKYAFQIPMKFGVDDSATVISDSVRNKIPERSRVQEYDLLHVPINIFVISPAAICPLPLQSNCVPFRLI